MEGTAQKFLERFKKSSKTFRYIAIDPRGQEKQGFIKASSLDHAKQKLEKQRWVPCSLEFHFATHLKHFRPSALTLSHFCRRWGKLLESGIPILKTFDILKKHTPRWTLILSKLQQSLEEGSTLSKACEEFPSLFDEHFRHSLLCAENNSRLPETLHHLADFFEKKHHYFLTLKKALIYPFFVLSISLGIGFFLFYFILPQIHALLKTTLVGHQLPRLSYLFMQLQHYVQLYGPKFIGVGIIAFIAFYFCYKKRPLFKQWIQKKLFSLPFIKMIVLAYAKSAFFLNCGYLMQNGLSLAQAFDLGLKGVRHLALGNGLQQVLKAMKEGEMLAQAMSPHAVFNTFEISLIEVGCNTGSLDKTFLSIAQHYEQESLHNLQILLNLLEPFITLILALIVGGIALVLFLPLLELMKQL